VAAFLTLINNNNNNNSYSETAPDAIVLTIPTPYSLHYLCGFSSRSAKVESGLHDNFITRAKQNTSSTMCQIHSLAFNNGVLGHFEREVASNGYGYRPSPPPYHLANTAIHHSNPVLKAPFQALHNGTSILNS